MTVNPKHPWTVLVLISIAQFMVVLDVTVVNVALPSIGDELGFTPGRLSWVVTAYVLFTGGLMLLGGRLADLAGRRPVFLAGLAVFSLASLASGLAWSPDALVAARALQGAGAALLLPSALAILTTTYEGRRRTVALSVWGALGSAGAAAGVLLGGILTTTLGWEAVFFINVPVGLAVAALALRAVPATPGSGLRGGLDLAGAATLLAGLVVLVLALEGGTALAVVALAVAARVLLGAFAAIERRARRPLLPPATWGNRPLVAGAAAMLAATGILVGAFLLSTLYLQHELGASALETGLAFLPMTLVIVAGAHAAAHLLPRAGTRPVLIAGLALAAAGLLTLSGAGAGASYATDLLPGFIAVGFGVGLAFVAINVTAMAEVGHHDAGLASGLMTTAHELGAALGVAVLGAVAAGEGHGTAFLVAAAIAAAAALAAAIALPSVRPEAGVAHPVH
jgi:EmrB/QacA subfamily drug resistance transporter